MKNRYRILTIIVAVLVILASVCAVVWEHINRTTAIRLRQDKESFEAEVSQNLPPGSNKVFVQRYLDSRHMTYIDTTPISDKASATNDVASLIEARSRQTIDLPLGSCSISATFTFDSRGTLLGYTDRHGCKWLW